MLSLRAILCHLGLLATGVAVGGDAPGRFYINYSARPAAIDLLAYDLSILDPHAKADLQPGHDLGHLFLAYVSLVEAAENSPAAAAARQRGVPFMDSNADWASHLLDVTSPAWRDFLMEDCGAQAAAKGYDGFFLDTIDSLERPGVKDKALARQTVIDGIRALHERWPNKRLVLNRGFALLKELAPSLHGVLVESVYQSFDPGTKRYRTVLAKDSQWLETRIREAQALGLTVYAVDYVSPQQSQLAEETYRRLEALNCIPLITTPRLNGVVIRAAKAP